MCIPKHVSGLLISLWEPANSLFVSNKYVRPTGKELHAGYLQKAEVRKKTYHLIPQLPTNNTCVWFNGDLLHTYRNYFDTTVYMNMCVHIYIYIYVCIYVFNYVCKFICMHEAENQNILRHNTRHTRHNTRLIYFIYQICFYRY